MNKDNILQNLKDAGCEQNLIDEFLRFVDSSNNTAALKILAKHKMELLSSLHKKQKEIDCLDFLIFKLKGKNNE